MEKSFVTQAQVTQNPIAQLELRWDFMHLSPLKMVIFALSPPWNFQKVDRYDRHDVERGSSASWLFQDLHYVRFNSKYPEKIVQFCVEW